MAEHWVHLHFPCQKAWKISWNCHFSSFEVWTEISAAPNTTLTKPQQKSLAIDSIKFCFSIIFSCLLFFLSIRNKIFDFESKLWDDGTFFYFETKSFGDIAFFCEIVKQSKQFFPCLVSRKKSSDLKLRFHINKNLIIFQAKFESFLLFCWFLFRMDESVSFWRKS